jgi:predicted P-loop ATPase
VTDRKRDPRDLPIVMAGPSESSTHLREAVLAASRRELPLIIIGTSGSPDYLRDGTGEQRFWPVTIPADVVLEDRQRNESDVEALKMYLNRTCDGLHDEGRGDLTDLQEDESGDDPRDEME